MWGPPEPSAMAAGMVQEGNQKTRWKSQPNSGIGLGSLFQPGRPSPGIGVQTALPKTRFRHQTEEHSRSRRECQEWLNQGGEWSQTPFSLHPVDGKSFPSKMTQIQEILDQGVLREGGSQEHQMMGREEGEGGPSRNPE
ncbi:MAG: hypothetical protein A2285_03850 [Elusimicrobia bacterium RIFOXYA12_FULL_57_11]|nr:MAG: hypothetical protein A2285_03850 [Elusimicrobia bacterium RIFOXYA12_FULL_57_11]